MSNWWKMVDESKEEDEDECGMKEHNRDDFERLEVGLEFGKLIYALFYAYQIINRYAKLNDKELLAKALEKKADIISKLIEEHSNSITEDELEKLLLPFPYKARKEVCDRNFLSYDSIKEIYLKLIDVWEDIGISKKVIECSKNIEKNAGLNEEQHNWSSAGGKWELSGVLWRELYETEKALENYENAIRCYKKAEKFNRAEKIYKEVETLKAEFPFFTDELNQIRNAGSLSEFWSALDKFDKEAEKIQGIIKLREKSGEGTKKLRDGLNEAKRKRKEIILKKKQDAEKELNQLRKELIDNIITSSEYDERKSKLESFLNELSKTGEFAVEDDSPSLKKKLEVIEELYLDGDITKDEYEEKKKILEKKILKNKTAGEE
jgi:hypothetical protein